MRCELNKKRVEKSLINDDVDGRLIQRIGHRHDIMECHAEAVTSQVQQNKSNSTHPEDNWPSRSRVARQTQRVNMTANGPERDLRSCAQQFPEQAYQRLGGAASSTRSRNDKHSVMFSSSPEHTREELVERCPLTTRHLVKCSDGCRSRKSRRRRDA